MRASNPCPKNANSSRAASRFKENCSARYWVDLVPPTPISLQFHEEEGPLRPSTGPSDS